MSRNTLIRSTASPGGLENLEKCKVRPGRGRRVTSPADIVASRSPGLGARRQSYATRSWKLVATFVILLSAIPVISRTSWADDHPPPGSYQTTCQSIRVVGTTLNATCTNITGQLVPSSFLANFNQCIGDIHNYNGQLHCNMGSTPPLGPYTETCRFIFTSGTTLAANCRNAGGKWVAQTYLVNFNQCIGDIHNYNGQLHCNMGSTPPPGPYIETCRFIFTSGTTLTANCLNADGQWAAQTSLPDFNHCVGSIVNFNGVLRCSRGEAPSSGSTSGIAVAYKVIALPLLPTHINEAGQVTGTTAEHHSALWSEQAGLRELPLPTGFSNSEATWVNNSGHVTGVVYDSNFSQHRAFLFANGTLTLLPGKQSHAYSISDSGEIAGESLLPGKPTTGPVCWGQKTIRPLGSCCGGSAKDVNEKGEVIADVYDNDGRYHAFLWTLDRGLRPIGPPDRYSSAIAINDQGHVVVQAFSAAYLYKNGILTPVELSSQYPSHPHAINNGNVIVGSFGPSADAERAFIWEESGGFRDLNIHIAAASGWKLESATSINDRGEIVGRGDYKGQDDTGFLLIPER